jgi:hypothetical protein
MKNILLIAMAFIALQACKKTVCLIPQISLAKSDTFTFQDPVVYNFNTASAHDTIRIYLSPQNFHLGNIITINSPFHSGQYILFTNPQFYFLNPPSLLIPYTTRASIKLNLVDCAASKYFTVYQVDILLSLLPDSK